MVKAVGKVFLTSYLKIDEGLAVSAVMVVVVVVKGKNRKVVVVIVVERKQ